MLEHELEVNEFQVLGGGPYDAYNVIIRRRPQIKGPDLWAVICNGTDNLNKDGQWEWEPRPSERTDEFLTRCRFADEGDAYKAWQASQAKKDIEVSIAKAKRRKAKRAKRKNEAM